MAGEILLFEKIATLSYK